MACARSVIFCLLMATLVASSAISIAPTDALAEHRERLRNNGNLADFALFTTIEFSSAVTAQQTKDSLNRGRTTLLEVMQKQRQQQHQKSSKGPAGGANDAPKRDASGRPQGPQGGEEDSGDNLQTLDTVDPRIAEVAFDVTLPKGGPTSPGVLGPIQLSGDTAVLVIVFQRYRRNFFGPEFYDLRTYCQEKEIDFARVMKDVSQNEDLARALSFEIWPNVEVEIKKHKLVNLVRDIKKVGRVEDPTTVPREALGGSKVSAAAMSKLVDRRKAFIASLPQWVIEQHPEAMMMDEEDVIAAGLGPGALRNPVGPESPVDGDEGDGAEESVVPEGTAAPSAPEDNDEF